MTAHTYNPLLMAALVGAIRDAPHVVQPRRIRSHHGSYDIGSNQDKVRRAHNKLIRKKMMRLARQQGADYVSAALIMRAAFYAPRTA